MKKYLPLLLCFLIPSAALCQQNLWEQKVSYFIEASLNDQENTIDGFIKIKYTNQSPDTLTFIWFHLWPNAFKNDQTFYSEQRLQNGKTDFYFENKEERGYLNHLDFRVGGVVAKTTDHPLYIDILKIALPNPLSPGGQVEITTPFHEQLPTNISGYGHVGQSYQLSQWYPKPAVYDQKGWHEMPFSDQGKMYSEAGSFEVHLTLPENYVVAASGTLKNESEKKWMLDRSLSVKEENSEAPVGKKIHSSSNQHRASSNKGNLRSDPFPLSPSSMASTKTLVFSLSEASDFVWFADKRFGVTHDSLALENGKIVDLWNYFIPTNVHNQDHNFSYTKQVLQQGSTLIGDYPYQTLSIVENPNSRMQSVGYPSLVTISSNNIEANRKSRLTESILENWFYSSLTVNENENAWMDDGLNNYFSHKINEGQTDSRMTVITSPSKWLINKMPLDESATVLQTMEYMKMDQPIQSLTISMTPWNEYLVVSRRTGDWLRMLEKYLGPKVFSNCIKTYYLRFKDKHPYPEDFKSLIESVSGRNINSLYELLNRKGALDQKYQVKTTKPAFLFNLHQNDQNRYLSFFPAAGFNEYDRFMIGMGVHNYNLPPNPLQFLAVPLYATHSGQLNGIAKIVYTWFPDQGVHQINIGLNTAKFSTLAGVDSNSHPIFGGFYKIVPTLRIRLKNGQPRSSIQKWIEWKTFLIGEKSFNYSVKSTDSNTYPGLTPYVRRYINQISFQESDSRLLYPYTVSLQVQQANDFYRVNFTGNYFFNYQKGGGMNLRVFAAKFGYIGNSQDLALSTLNYQPQLTASAGNQDYTYANYFIGRNEMSGLPSQQFIMQDGGLKLRLNQFPYVTGQSQNWVAAMNFNTTLPDALIPAQIPLRIFFDIGSYAEAWSPSPTTSKFLYVGGLQLSLWKNILNIYAPLIYSSDFKNVLKTLGPENGFFQKLSFSIDIQNIGPRNFLKNYPF